MAIDLRKKAAKEFAAYWKDKGDEKQHTQMFWSSLVRDVFGIEHPEDVLFFEDRVVADKSTQYEDVWIPSTKVMIEQKSSWKDLNDPIKQSDGTLKTAYEQAEAYANTVEYDRNPRWIICCNFKEFHIHDMNKTIRERKTPVAVIKLNELEKEFYRLNFIVDQQAVLLQKELELSIQAGELVGKLYDSLIKQYRNPDSKESQHSLNVLCVRLVFCLYAEDAGLFGKSNMFHDYLKVHNAKNLRQYLINLFEVLDTPVDERDPYLDDELNSFPYVNGGLFSDKNIEIPQITEEIKTILLDEASEKFNWSEISPTIFGAVFESTLNPQTRHSGGMHYTSVENIHKVIDPLFLDSLKEEFNQIKQLKQYAAIEKKTLEFQKKLASLKFLDPAAGSGNFCTESYISLRRLENECLKLKVKFGQQRLGFDGEENPIKVNIQQFYGIEINDFAVTVAKTALWIAESQMMKETESIIHMNLNFLPLKSYSNMIQGNALRMDWNDLIDKKELNYIMGNPPFLGARLMDGEQKKDVLSVFGNIKDVQDLDYVTCWYKIAASMMFGTEIETAFVSTNSICQGAQVPILWNVLLNEYQVHINFAYQTFKWNSESVDKAAVHCIIVGFSNFERKNKYLYSFEERKEVINISPYLVEGNDFFVTAQKTAICDVPKMNFGNQPRDGGHFVIKKDEYQEILRKEPNLTKWLYPYIGADEFINNKERWCLWLVDASPFDIKSSKILSEKVDAVYKFRMDSKAKTTNGYAKVPSIFAQITQPLGNRYLMIPSTTSSNRKYIPIGFMNGNVVSSNLVMVVPNADLFHFGILTSKIHMIWMSRVCGRLGNGYRYSKEIVYNTFPWPNINDRDKRHIEETAQLIIKAREKYSEYSFADLYGEYMYLYPELVKAHDANDKAVMKAYGFKPSMTEDEIVAELFKMYQKKVSE